MYGGTKVAGFNQTAVGAMRTTNREGHIAYKMEDKENLVTKVLTTFFGEPKFYGDTDKELLELASKLEPEFVVDLAVFARHEFHMRSVTHALTAVLAHRVDAKHLVRELVNRVVVRADDMTEILAAYLVMFGKPIPNSLKKGIGDAFKRFDEYALAKYKGKRDKLKMRDVLCICHPKPKNDEQSALWKRLIAGELATPDTWETELSAKGNTKEVWEGLLERDAVGYMAMLRNMRNIINAQPSNIQLMYAKIADTEQVRKSRQFPFAFLSAYKELQQVPNASSKAFFALEKAMDASVVNLPKIPGRTCIAVDVSGSMTSAISSRSKMTCAEIAVLLGVMAGQICEDSIFVTFDTGLYPQAVTPGSLLMQTRNICVNGGGTDISLPFKYLMQHRLEVDRVILLSDNMVNCGTGGKTVQSFADEYRSKMNNSLWVHAVDLQGYGTQQFIGNRTNIIAGWSEKLLEFILLAEEGMGSLVKRIEDYRVVGN